MNKTLKEKIEQLAEETGQSQSEIGREALAEYVGESPDPFGFGLDSKRLSAAYYAMWRAADPAGKLPVEVAKARAAEAPRVKKEDVKRSILKPLEQRNYLQPIPLSGRIMLNPAHKPNLDGETEGGA